MVIYHAMIPFEQVIQDALLFNHKQAGSSGRPPHSTKLINYGAGN